MPRTRQDAGPRVERFRRLGEAWCLVACLGGVGGCGDAGPPAPVTPAGGQPPASLGPFRFSGAAEIPDLPGLEAVWSWSDPKGPTMLAAMRVTAAPGETSPPLAERLAGLPAAREPAEQKVTLRIGEGDTLTFWAMGPLPPGFSVDDATLQVARALRGEGLDQFAETIAARDGAAAEDSSD